MDSKALISIIIPVFNRQELIKETLDSVLAQTYKNWECIVVDDGSTDRTWEVLEEYAQNDSRIKIYKRHRQPKGASTCRNMGIDESEGKFIVFLDSDDLLTPWALEKRMELIDSKENYDVVISNGTQFSFDKAREIYNTSMYGVTEILVKFLQFQVVFQTTCPTWRKSFLIENKIRWDEEAIVWQDVDFHIKCFSKHPKYRWGEKRSENFIRNENDENRITSSKNIVKKIINNIEVYERWLLNGENKRILLKCFPVCFLNRDRKSVV